MSLVFMGKKAINKLTLFSFFEKSFAFLIRAKITLTAFSLVKNQKHIKIAMKNFKASKLFFFLGLKK